MAGLTKQEKKALKLFKKLLIKEFGDRLDSMRLFGSKARGDAHSESDVDVLVVLQTSDERNRDKVIRLASRVITETGVVISPKVFSEKKIAKSRKRRNVFIQSVDRESVAL